MEIKHNSLKKPENSGSSAQVLASLRAEKIRRTPSIIIKHHRATKALAASRMAAQVALDKLEARAGKIVAIATNQEIEDKAKAANVETVERMADAVGARWVVYVDTYKESPGPRKRPWAVGRVSRSKLLGCSIPFAHSHHVTVESAIARAKANYKAEAKQIVSSLRAAAAEEAAVAAQVALDKLEARGDGLGDFGKAASILHTAARVEDRAVSLHAADLLDHARDNGSTLERALEDFQGESELLGELGDLVLSRAYDIDAEVA